MRELTVEEMGQVGGGYSFNEILGDATNLATKTGFVGSIIGYAVTGTTAGAAHGGWWGAGIGFAWGAGYGFGTALYDTYIERLLFSGSYY